jgi:hypothetical protein
MAKKTLLTENQVSNFMKLANIKQDKINNFKKNVLNETYTGLEGTGDMGEDEAADAGPSDEGDDMGTGMEADAMDMEPEAPSTEADFEGGADDFKAVLRDALKEVLPQVMAELEGAEEADEEEDMDLDMDLASDDEEVDMEDEEEEMDMEEEGEEEELQEAKHDKKDKKAAKKAHNLKGGDQKKMKESLAFDNVDLVTDDEIINEVLKRVIRRIV